MIGLVVLAAMLLLRPITAGTPFAFTTVGDYLQAVESVINEAVFLGIAVWFLGSLEMRAKRRRALAAIHSFAALRTWSTCIN